MRKWQKADQIHIQNLRKALMKVENLNIDVKGVVEAYHAFSWLDKLADEVDEAINNPTPDSMEEAIKTAEIKPNKEAKTAVKSTKKTTKKATRNGRK